MKRYGDLFTKVCDLDNIREAHRRARRGKTRYRAVRRVDADVEKHIRLIRDMLMSGQYRTSRYRVFHRVEGGKQRLIHALPYFPDRIIHHCIMQVVEPLWRRSLIRDTYASLPGRGVHDGVRRIQQALRTDPAGTVYCLKMDVRQFYPSLDHDVLKRVVRQKIKDAQLLRVLDEIIDSVPQGVPIGNYLSQYFGNLYLSGIDHAAKERLHLRHYFRYCDDIVVLGPDKARLHKLRRWFAAALARVKLTLKPNWQVFPVDARGVDFLGYVFYHGKTRVRRRIADAFRARMKALRHTWRNLEPLRALSSIMSFYGWTKAAGADAHVLYHAHALPKIQQRLRCLIKEHHHENALQHAA